jgi:gamma-glutamyltranspeptidase / glutathione hydrolase / leukotriene-C4 hydrolase
VLASIASLRRSGYESDGLLAGKFSKDAQSVARGKNGAVATENPLCSLMGLEILKKGGSAIDSAITACICMGTTHMYSSGIGGGGFSICFLPSALQLEQFCWR